MRLLACLLLLGASLDAAAGDLYASINRLRAGEGACAAVRNLPPLKPQAALERVARALSQGGDLKQSLQGSGYRGTRARAIALRGVGVGGYCAQLQDAAMTEVGVYEDAGRVWIVTAAPVAPWAGMSGPAAGRRVLELVNQARATPRSCGNRAFSAARPVRWNDTLAEASRLHSVDMARHHYFSHSGRDGSNPGQRVQRAGYRYRATGENLAVGGQMTPEIAVAGWIKSPGHCANLMNPAFAEMGAAFAVEPKSETRVYWTQAFGTPR
jgi:uncharacterized protein YkwD